MAFAIRCDRCGGTFHWSEVREHRRQCNQPERERLPYRMPCTDNDCQHPGCPNWADHDDGLCDPHHWQAEHPDELYDPFVFTSDSSVSPRATFPTLPKTSTDERKPSRSSAGMGSGQHKPEHVDYDLCRLCGMPHHRADGDREEVEVFDKDGRRSVAYKPVPCEHKDLHDRRGLPLKPDWPSGYPVIYDPPDEPEDNEERVEDDNEEETDEVENDEDLDDDEDVTEEEW